MAARGLLPRLEHRRIFKFLSAAAAHAHQMVMVAMGVTGQLKAAPTLGQLQLLQQPHGAQQPQGAVHRGQRYPLLAPEQALVHLFSSQVATFTDALEQGQHTLPLGREPLTAIVQAGAQAIPTSGKGWGGKLGSRAWSGSQSVMPGFSTIGAVAKTRCSCEEVP